MKKLLLSSSVTSNIKDSAILAEELELGIEISRFPNFKNIDKAFNQILAELQKQLQDFSGFKTIHGMFFDQSVASIDPEIRAISQKRHRQSLEAAKAIKADIVVFHSGNKGMKHKVSQEKFKNSSIIFWKEFIKEFEEANITAVIENVLEKDYELILDIITGVDSPNLKASIDTGHANLFSDVKISEWIRAYGKHLHHMHIHNNFGDDDSHYSLLNGNIDFNEVFETLKELDLNPVIVFEIFKKDDLIESLDYFKKTFGDKICLKN